ETDVHTQRLGWPFGRRAAPAACTVAGRLPLVDFASGQGHSEEVLVDGVALLLAAHAETARLQKGLFVRTRLGVLLLDFTYRRDDLPIALRFHSQVEAYLVVAHAGVAVCDGPGTQLGSTRKGRFHDQITVGYQQRILPLIPLACPYERLDEVLPQRRTAIDGNVAGHAQFMRAIFDEGTLLGVHATGIGENGMHGPTLFPEPGHTETGIKAAGKGENDIAHCRGSS